MKKFKLNTLVLIILVSICICGCSACSDNEQTKGNAYETTIVDAANDGICYIQGESDIWTSEEFKTNCKRTMKRNVCGYSLKGKYIGSEIGENFSYTTNVYECENDVEFGIRADNKKVVFVNFMNKDFFETEPYLEDVTNTEEYCCSLAYDIAAEFIDDINEYTLLKGNPKKNTREKNGEKYERTYYFYTFYKTIAGYNSSDYIDIKVTSKGHLASVFVGDTGAFENESFSIDKDLLQQSIEKKVKDTYNETGYILKNFEVTDQMLVKAPNENFYIYSKVEVILDISTETQSEELSTGIELITLVK